MRIESRKNPIFNRGVLENAGLGEVAFYLKKAKENLSYAMFALDHTDFDSVQQHIADVSNRISSLEKGLSETSYEIDNIIQVTAEKFLLEDFYGKED